MFFTVIMSKVDNATEQIVKKRHLTFEATARFVNSIHTPILPSSCDDLVDTYSSNLVSTIDVVAPAKIKRVRAKQRLR